VGGDPLDRRQAGCAAETLRSRARQAKRDQAKRPGITSDERQRLKNLERENFELRARSRPEEGVGVFRAGGA
jgi:hypothetical protein